jgi:hypothetical protein
MAHNEEDVTYTIDSETIVDGAKLLPGTYKGKKVRLLFPSLGGPRPESWEYRINTKDFSDLDCTEQVRKGEIKVLKAAGR